ncbi:hypothetical protein [Confluentibacter flavum]|uniref:Uncharacterized protein n=1 Tax=Confluentibacter flavum TaxID=1909700 RepID=A0A2N3HH99_9FLAO|nr:hypothetical protein [Confluentibacter flavum]PKQ44178.1 hypothetical protein CSW08_13830 [Confluentibacter flavum]
MSLRLNKINGQMIIQGMAKEGSQSHIHMIVSNEKRLNRLGVNYQKIDGEKLACQWKPEDSPENEVLE